MWKRFWKLTEFIMNFQNIETHFGRIFKNWDIIEIRNFFSVDIFEVWNYNKMSAFFQNFVNISVNIECLQTFCMQTKSIDSIELKFCHAPTLDRNCSCCQIAIRCYQNFLPLRSWRYVYYMLHMICSLARVLCYIDYVKIMIL